MDALMAEFYGQVRCVNCEPYICRCVNRGCSEYGYFECTLNGTDFDSGSIESDNEELVSLGSARFLQFNSNLAANILLLADEVCGDLSDVLAHFSELSEENGWENIVILDSIHITPTMQGLGYGTSLLKEVQHYAFNVLHADAILLAACDNITPDIVDRDASFERLNRFYLAQGFCNSDANYFYKESVAF